MILQAMVPGISSDRVAQATSKPPKLEKQSSSDSIDSAKLRSTGAKFMDKFRSRRSMDRSDDDLSVAKSSSSVSITNMLRQFKKSKMTPEVRY